MINYISSAFRWFFKLEAASGLLLLISAVCALIISNSVFSSTYFNVLETYFFIGINNIGIKLANTDYVYILNPDVTLNANTLENIYLASKEITEFSILTPINFDLNYPNWKKKHQPHQPKKKL